MDKRQPPPGLWLFLEIRYQSVGPGCSGMHSADQTSLELRNLAAFALKVLGLKACATTQLLVWCCTLFGVVLGMEPETSYMLGKPSTPELL